MRHLIPYIVCFSLLTALHTAGNAQGLTDHVIELVQRPLVSGERAQVQRLTRDMDSVLQTVDQGGIAPFQDPAYVQRWQQRIEQFRTTMERYPQADDPDVQAANAKLAELAQLVAFAINEAARQQAELGDVQATLANLETALHTHRAPQWLPAPFTDEEVQRWANHAITAKQTAEQAIEAIQRIAATAHLPPTRGTVQQGAPYDRQDLDRLINFASRTIRTVDEAVQQTVANLQLQRDTQNRELEYFRTLDPDNDHHRTNAFLREGAAAEIYARLDRELAFAESIAAYQRVLGREPSANTLERIDEIHALRETYAANRLRVIGESRLPEPASTDTQRIAIAERILAEPRYAFGEHGPIILTTPEIVEREQQVSRAEIKNVEFSISGDITLSGTETTWHYRWQEFRFATPIRDADSGDWYIWWITAKNYASGWERTPIGQWVSGVATKGDLILEENFARF